MRFFGKHRLGAFACAAGLAAGCTQSVQTMPFHPNELQGATQRAAERAARSLLYVANANTPSITEYRLNADGNVPPVRTIAGPKTKMGHGIGGIAVDTQGITYVTLVDGGIREYAPRADGNIPPVRTIKAATNGPIDGFELALDPADNLYVANGEDIKVFAPGAHGVATPIADIAGPNTTIGFVEGVAVDAAGAIYAVDFANVAVLKFAPGSTGDVAPIATIAGDKTTLAFPRYAGVSPGGQIYVSDEDAVQVFSARANGNVRPARIITFNNGEGPYGNVSIWDKHAFLGQFAQNPPWTVGVYHAGLHAPAPPVHTIAGDKTLLNAPVGLTVR